MARRYRRTTPSSTVDLDNEVAEYLLNRSTRERSEHQEKTWKAKFMALLEEVGEAQEGGHRVLPLNEPITFHSYKTGKVKETEVVGIRRVRREVTALNVERVMKLLEDKDMVADCTVTRTDIDEDAILAANFEGRITDEEMDALWDKSENFAFYLVEE